MYNEKILEEYHKNIQPEEKIKILHLCKVALKSGRFKRIKTNIYFDSYGYKTLYINSLEYDNKENIYKLEYYSNEARKAYNMYFGDVGPNEHGKEFLYVKDDEIIDLYKTAKTAREILNANIKKFISNKETSIELSADANGNAEIILESSNDTEYFNIRQYDIKCLSISGFKITVTYYDIGKDNLLCLKQEILDIAKFVDLKKYVTFIFEYV